MNRPCILISAVGSHGDIHPCIGLGQELRRRGHQVVFFTSAYFETVAREAGLDFVGLGTAEEYERQTSNPDLWHPRKGLRLIFDAVIKHLPTAYGQLLEYYRPGRTLLVGSTLAFAARLLQETYNAPLATVHLAPSVFRSVYETPKLPGLFLPGGAPHWYKRTLWWLVDNTGIRPLLCPKLNAYRATLGLPPLKRPFRDWIHSPDLVLGLFPDWFGAPQSDWPAQTRLAGFPLYDQAKAEGLPDEIDSFLTAGPPPVVFTSGSAMRHARRFFAESAKACEQLKRRGLLLARFPEQLPETLPGGVASFPYAPFSQLLPRAAALIHHGGVGSCAQALAAGIPQLVRPLAYDQFDNSWRLQRLGVAQRLDDARYRAETVATALDELLTSAAVQRRCGELARRMAGVRAETAACDLIEKMPAR